MLSLSDNEFAVINFLVRNFTDRLTVRSIAKKLGFSPAGVYNILKKLEDMEIVYGEKLGTGLFYKINLNSKVAWYLSLSVLVGFFDYKINLDKYKPEAKAALFDKKNILFIVDGVSVSDFQIEGVNTIVKTLDEFIEAVKKKDSVALSILKNSSIIFGEETVAEVVKKFTERF